MKKWSYHGKRKQNNSATDKNVKANASANAKSAKEADYTTCFKKIKLYSKNMRLK